MLTWQRSQDYAREHGDGLRLRLRLTDAPSIAGLPGSCSTTAAATLHRAVRAHPRRPLPRGAPASAAASRGRRIAHPRRHLLAHRPAGARRRGRVATRAGRPGHQGCRRHREDRPAAGSDHPGALGVVASARRPHPPLHRPRRLRRPDPGRRRLLPGPVRAQHQGQPDRSRPVPARPRPAAAGPPQRVPSARVDTTDPFSGMAQGLVQQDCTAVVAMQFPISDGAATTFTAEFYGALADGFPVDQAATSARKALIAEYAAEWATPVLFLRAPDGRVFDHIVAQPTVTAVPTPLPPSSGKTRSGRRRRWPPTPRRRRRSARRSTSPPRNRPRHRPRNRSRSRRSPHRRNRLLHRRRATRCGVPPLRQGRPPPARAPPVPLTQSRPPASAPPTEPATLHRPAGRGATDPGGATAADHPAADHPAAAPATAGPATAGPATAGPATAADLPAAADLPDPDSTAHRTAARPDGAEVRRWVHREEATLGPHHHRHPRRGRGDLRGPVLVRQRAPGEGGPDQQQRRIGEHPDRSEDLGHPPDDRPDDQRGRLRLAGETPTFDSNVLIAGSDTGLLGHWGLSWDDENLYFIVAVTDRTALQTHTSDTSQLFKGDGVNFEFRTALPKNKNASSRPATSTSCSDRRTSRTTP